MGHFLLILPNPCLRNIVFPLTVMRASVRLRAGAPQFAFLRANRATYFRAYSHSSASSQKMSSTKRVLVPIANGSEEIEAVSIIDTLRRAGAEVTGEYYLIIF